MLNFIPSFKVVRKVYNEQGILRIDLGRHWEIYITRKLAETTWNDPRQPHNFSKHKQFIKKLKEGDIIPSWYGYAAYDFDCELAIYMPIPLNFVRAAWVWFKFNILRAIKFGWPWAMTLKYRREKSRYEGVIETLTTLIDICRVNQLNVIEEDLRDIQSTLEKLNPYR